MTPMVLWAAGVAAMCAALLSGPSPPALLRSRLPVAAGPVPALPALHARGPRSGRHWCAAVAVALALLVVLHPSGLLLVGVVGVLTGGVVWLYAGARRRRAAEHRRRQTIESCDALVAELRAGQPAVLALARAAEHHPVLLPAARACVLGGDAPAVLRGIATDPGLGGMGAVAAAWSVSDGSGAGLVSVLEPVVAGLRTEESTHAEVVAALAPARATARMLAVLPVFGLVLGSGLGGDPLGFLLDSPVGHLLLLAGVTLALAGTAWVERIADRVGA